MNDATKAASEFFREDAPASNPPDAQPFRNCCLFHTQGGFRYSPCQEDAPSGRGEGYDCAEKNCDPAELRQRLESKLAQIKASGRGEVPAESPSSVERPAENQEG